MLAFVATASSPLGDRDDSGSRAATAALEAGGPATAPDEPGVAYHKIPTIVTKADLYSYLHMLVDLAKSLNDEDLLAHSVYYDPDDEQTKVEDLLRQAKEIDGCDQGLTCPGWQDGSAPAIDPSQQVASDLRRKAFQHRVNARFMEDRIKARGYLSQKRVDVEVRIWKDWLLYRKALGAYMESAEKGLLFKDSDFQEVQRFDLLLQQFRQRYRSAVGLNPSTPWPPPLPDEGALSTFRQASKIVMVTAVALGGLYVAYRYLSKPTVVEPTPPALGPASVPAPTSAFPLAPALAGAAAGRTLPAAPTALAPPVPRAAAPKPTRASRRRERARGHAPAPSAPSPVQAPVQAPVQVPAAQGGGVWIPPAPAAAAAPAAPSTPRSSMAGVPIARYEPPPVRALAPVQAPAYDADIDGPDMTGMSGGADPAFPDGGAFGEDDHDFEGGDFA
jgi:hypothetical protein